VEGQLRCELGWFLYQTSHAIEISAFRSARQHVEFIDNALAQASDALKNAIPVWYLENVFGLNILGTLLPVFPRELHNAHLVAKFPSPNTTELGGTVAPAFPAVVDYNRRSSFPHLGGGAIEVLSCCLNRANVDWLQHSLQGS
jgi:hypothetical protein